MPEIFLTAENLHKSFDAYKAVNGVSFNVHKGEIFGLLGPNGAGKTTTIRILSTVLSPDHGDALIGGHSIRHNAEAVRRLIGVCPQELALYPDLSALDNLLFFGRMELFSFLLFPFLFVGLFSVILSGVGSEDERLELHVVTQEDRGGLSHHIVDAIVTDDESELEPGEPVIVHDDDYEEAYRAVVDGELAGFIAFPEDFTDGISMGYGSHIEVVADPEHTYVRAALNAIAEAVASQVGRQQVAGNAITELMIERWMESTGEVADVMRELPELLSVQWGAPGRPTLVEYDIEKIGKVEAENPSTYVIPGYLVMFVFMAAAFSAESLVRERQNRTLERLLSTSVRRESIIVGVFTGTSTKGLTQIAIFWTVGLLVFSADFNAAVPEMPALLSFAVVFGIVAAYRFRTSAV